MKNDETLLQELKAGKPEAVREWFELYHGKVLALTQSKLPSDQDAEEITQETFINCLKQINIFRGESSLWTWMQSVARHEIADYYRKRYAKKALRTIPLADFLLTESERTLDDVSDRVKFVLSKMEAYTQELLKKKYIDGKKVAEIARELGKSAKAIEAELYRARAKFRKLWEAEFGSSSALAL